MTSAPKSPDLVLRLRDLARGEGGMAAVEFALILPFMLIAYLGGVEVGDGVAINRKVAITTRAVAGSRLAIHHDPQLGQRHHSRRLIHDHLALSGGSASGHGVRGLHRFQR